MEINCRYISRLPDALLSEETGFILRKPTLLASLNTEIKSSHHNLKIFLQINLIHSYSCVPHVIKIVQKIMESGFTKFSVLLTSC